MFTNAHLVWLLHFSTEFEINSHGHLIYKAGNLCARPASNKAVSGAKIEMVSTSSGCHKFGFTRLGSLQHVQSRLCLQTAKRVSVVRINKSTEYRVYFVTTLNL